MKREALLRLIALIAWSWLGGGPIVRAAEWAQWLGPSRNGVSSETVTAWTEAPPVLWRKSVGNAFSSPVVAGGSVYLHTVAPGEEAEDVFAYDAVTGDVRWKDRYPRETYQSELGTGPRGTPSVVDGRLYTLGITGVLSCYKAETGERIWQMNPYEELRAPRPGFGVCTSPLVTDGKVFLPVGGAESGIAAIDAATGEVAWTALDEPAGTASPVLIARGDGDLRRNEVIAQTTLRLVGLNPQDGALNWEHPIVFEPAGVSPTPLALHDLLVCSTQDTGTLTLKLPGDQQSQPELAWWNQDVSSYFSTGTIDEQGRAYIITNALSPLPRADIRCIRINDGKELWAKEKVGYFHVGMIRTGDGKLLLLDDSGNLVLTEPTDTELKELCRTKACGGTFCNPALAGGLLFARDNQQLVCLDLNNTTADRKED